MAQVCDNLALSFDNANPAYVSLSPSPVVGSGNFTVEAWFYANSSGTGCLGDFRTLFSLGDPGSGHSFELGICNGGQLNFYWYNGNPAIPLGPIPISGTDYSGACHHVAVTRNGNQVEFFVDGVSIYATTVSTTPFNFSTFQIGWDGGAILGHKWDGLLDEIRVWNTVRTPAQIHDFKDCVLSGNLPNLLLYWTFEEPGISPGGNNTGSGAVATDQSGHGNDGTLHGFALNGSTSNFVCNTCPPAYELSISDLPSPFPVLLTTICSGQPAHLCVTENFNQISAGAGTTVTWESSDGILPFTTDLDLLPYGNLGYTCFGVPPGVLIAHNCATSTTGYEDRRYRAKITKSMPVSGGIQYCTYTTSIADLRICCPVTGAAVQAVVQAPLPFNGTLCDDPAVPVTIDVSLTGPTFLNNLPIQWCLNGQPITGVGSVTSFTYNGPAVWPQMCFEAKIQNCACPLVNPKVCIPVDPLPMCGTIDVVTPNTLMHDPSGGQYDYLICPGDHTMIEMLNPLDFKNCNATWQYHFDTEAPGVWHDLLGTTNTVQNTNILPQLSPPNSPVSPYLWPSGAQCISYRIECRPYNYPNSGCAPCHSNEVRICLKPPPPPDVITGVSQICFPSSTTLTLSNPGPYTYTWYWNGLQVQSGPSASYIANKAGCYWVEISDGCQKTVTPQFCLDVCVIVPIIKCPEDNPCACDNMPITLDGCDSFDTCLGTGPLTYSWSWDSGTLVSVNGCILVHIPDPNGTTYTLTVCNSLNPACCATTTLTIKPCQ